MRKKLLYPALFLLVLVFASVNRLHRLEDRPLHTDEAVQAMKTGALLEGEAYRYDPEEYHGPTLSYLSLPIVWMAGEKDLLSLREETLRTVPALAGILCIMVLLALLPGTGWPFVLLSGALMAFSPSLSYFSRYYIHESLLAFFTLGTAVCYLRFLRDRKVWSLMACGIFGGLLIATKETWPIHLGALAVPVWILSNGRLKPQQGKKKDRPSLVFFLIPLILIPALFYSSFLQNPGGIADAFRTFATYAGRAGTDPDHLHPFWYYFGKLCRGGGPGSIPWSEGWVVLAALGGGIFLLRQKGPGREVPLRQVAGFMALAGLLLALVYSIIPYKTPWILINFQLFVVPLAAYGILRLFSLHAWGKLRPALAGLFIILGTISVLHCRQILWTHGSHPANPFVYAHPTEDIFEISETLHRLADACPEGRDTYIEIIFSGHEYWPLPWYLRDLRRTGWFEEPDPDAPAAPLVLADPAAEPQLLLKWYELPPEGQRHLYLPLFEKTMQIRHGVEIRGYIRRDFHANYFTR